MRQKAFFHCDISLVNTAELISLHYNLLCYCSQRWNFYLNARRPTLWINWYNGSSILMSNVKSSQNNILLSNWFYQTFIRSIPKIFFSYLYHLILYFHKFLPYVPIYLSGFLLERVYFYFPIHLFTFFIYKVLLIWFQAPFPSVLSVQSIHLCFHSVPAYSVDTPIFTHRLYFVY